METINKLEHSANADQAYGRIDALLRAYGFSHSVSRSQYCLHILDQALADYNNHPEQALESLAATITLERIRTGVEKILLEAELSTESLNVEDVYLALQAARIPQDAPEIILGNSPADGARLQAIRMHYESQSKPTLRRISMGAPSLRFDTIDEVTDSTERFLQQHPLLLHTLKLTLVMSIIYLVYIFAK
ncbi:hypothetical protein QEH59_12320 [Coraliomargarita sp. SDUM461004]|uniref:Uncharacterized protein n=1 Tax=Thalassobacterium sedimentorum TaxID=3041258 RepID=A0ABU1AK77_9BACT|nr:hypothetical protein [Coraliomargarita sp. SDUM461004]MDQ8195215.1 hypothetical protein [Coraliomargarita sp. SDUM461004]